MNRLTLNLALAVLAACALTAATSLAAPAGNPRVRAAATYTTKLKDSYFSPSVITAKGKATVRFVWAGQLTHNLDGRGVPDKYLKAKLRHRPLTRTYGRGVYTFLCTIHPGMELKLRVR